MISWALGKKGSLESSGPWLRVIRVGAEWPEVESQSPRKGAVRAVSPHLVVLLSLGIN